MASDIKSGSGKGVSGALKRFPNAVIFITAFIIVLVAELTVFQYRFFTPVFLGASVSDFSADEINPWGDAVKENGIIRVDGKATIVLYPEDTPVTTVTLKLADGQVGEYKLSAKWRDEGRAMKDTVGVTQTAYASIASSGEYHMSTQGDCSELTITVNADEGLDIIGIALNKPFYDFNIYRVIAYTLILFLIVFAARGLKKGALPSSCDSLEQRRRLVTTVFVGFMVTVFLLSPGYEKNTEHCYIDKLYYGEPDTHDAYMMLTDALADGRLELDVPVDMRLEEKENPYDYTSRTGVGYTWDFAYYDGAYYSYFGIIPALAVLLPFRLITGRFLSSYIFAFLLGVAAAIALSRLYALIIRRFFDRVNGTLYSLGLATLLFGSALAFLSGRSWFYEIPYNSGLLCSFISLIYIVKASGAESGSFVARLVPSGAFSEKRYASLTWKTPKRNKYIFISALFLGLAVGCRPTCLLFIIPAVPFIVQIVRTSPSFRSTAKSAFHYAIPLVAVLAGLGIYNYLRFDSFFQFGAVYQLTVSDVHYNTLSNLPLTVTASLQYLFQMPLADADFPFFHSQKYTVLGASHYYYDNKVTGILAYPVTWTLPASLLSAKFRKRPTTFFCFVAALGVCGAATLVAVAASAGVMERYTVDFKWLFVFAAVLAGIYAVSRDAKRQGGGRSFSASVFLILCAITIAVSAAISMTGEMARISKSYPETFYNISKAFEIFR